MQTTIDGIRIAYDIAGSAAGAGSGETIVLLHGFLLDRTIWDDAFATLARRHRVIRIDLRGSGESECGVGPALMETLAGDVCGLLDVLGIERVILAGHSMGGYVALAFFRMYAERVAGLALVASQTAADAPARARVRDAQALRVVEHGAAVLTAELLPMLFAPDYAAANPAIVETVRAIGARSDPAGAAAQIVGMKERVDSADLLEDIRVPTLILGGRQDALIAAETLERTAAALADCELVLLPDAGHMPMFEAAAAMSAALERLAARCAVSAAADPQSARATPA